VDDLVILSSTHKGLQNALNKLEKYCFDWQLTVNIKKTKVMTFQNTLVLFPFALSVALNTGKYSSGNQTSQLYSKSGQIKISQSLHDKFTGNV
jgi:hypothetical protein